MYQINIYRNAGDYCNFAPDVAYGPMVYGFNADETDRVLDYAQYRARSADVGVLILKDGKPSGWVCRSGSGRVSCYGADKHTV